MLSRALAFSMSIGAGMSTLSVLPQNDRAGVAGMGGSPNRSWARRVGPDKDDDRLEGAPETGMACSNVNSVVGEAMSIARLVDFHLERLANREPNRVAMPANGDSVPSRRFFPIMEVLVRSVSLKQPIS
jgi:hypothetical protein